MLLIVICYLLSFWPTLKTASIESNYTLSQTTNDKHKNFHLTLKNDKFSSSCASFLNVQKTHDGKMLRGVSCTLERWTCTNTSKYWKTAWNTHCEVPNTIRCCGDIQATTKVFPRGPPSVMDLLHTPQRHRRPGIGTASILSVISQQFPFDTNIFQGHFVGTKLVLEIDSENSLRSKKVPSWCARDLKRIQVSAVTNSRVKTCPQILLCWQKNRKILCDNDGWARKNAGMSKQRRGLTVEGRVPVPVRPR